MAEAPQSKKSLTIIIAVVVVLAVVGSAVGYFYVYPNYIEDDDDGDGPPEKNNTKNRRPMAKIRAFYEGYFPVAGAQIWFNGSESQDPNGDSLTYSWDFDDNTDLDGDGNYRNDNEKQGMNVSWIYPSNGTFLVTLTVNDSLLEDTGTYVLVVRIASNNEYPFVILTVAGKKAGITGKLYVVTVAEVDPLFLAENYTVRLYDVDDENTSVMYEEPVDNLTAGVVYRDLDNDQLLSQGDLFQVTPSTELDVEDGDLFILVYRELEVGYVPFDSFGV